MSRFSEDPGYQAFRILQCTFVVAPILAGLDKFFNFLTYWPQYLSPCALQIIHQSEQKFMTRVGIIEIVIGIGVLFKPKFFSYVIALWLLGIIVNLLCSCLYFDIALRDFGLLRAALSLARLTTLYAA